MLGKEPIALAKVPVEILPTELMTEPIGLLVAQGRLADRGVGESVGPMRAGIARMRKSVAACRRSAVVSETLSGCACVPDVSGVTGVCEMSPRMGAARVETAAMRTTGVDMRAATMRPAGMTDRRAVSGETARMPTADVRGAATTEMHAAAAEVWRAATAEMHAAATKVRTAATKMRAATAEVGATTAAAEMRRSDCERKGGHTEGQSGRHSSNDPTRHITTPTI